MKTNPLHTRPSVWDRLFEDGDDALPMLPTQSVERLKRQVAGDIERLLNTRLPPLLLDEQGPALQQSVVSYGVRDFIGVALRNTAERRRTLQAITDAIRHHEKRLNNVHVELREGPPGSATTVNAMAFSIRADLVVHPARETVSFDAVLQPSLSQFAVRRD